LASGGAAKKLLDNRLAIVGLLVVVGPLGLPFLWLSGRFSRLTKFVVTTLYFAFTVVFPLAVTWYWLDTAMQPLLEAFGRPPIEAAR
jgi:hypothetical protein